MGLKKTLYYPVDVIQKLVYLAPERKPAEVATQWRDKAGVMAIKGAHLDGREQYHGYAIVPTLSQEGLVNEWREEAQRSLYLWKSVALAIAEIIEKNTPEQALIVLRREYQSVRKRMAISASYYRAVREVRELIQQRELIATHTRGPQS